MTGLGALLREGVTATIQDRRGLLIFALPAAVFMALAWTAADRFADRAALITVLVELCLAYVAFFWQRRYLMGHDEAAPEGEARREQQREINRLAGRYVGRAAVFFLTIVVLALMLAFPLFAPFLREDDPDTVLVFLVILVLVVAALLLAGARFLLAFPACASGTRMGWGDAWRLGRGHGLSLGFVVLLFSAPAVLFAVAYALLAPLTWQETVAGQLLLDSVVAVLRIGGMFMALVSAAYLYRQLTPTVDADAFS
jgi:hypothetical protein